MTVSVSQAFSFRNDTGLTVPPFGLIQCREIIKRTSDGYLAFKGEKPAYSDINHLYRNGSSEVAPNGYGACYAGDVMEVAYDPADGTPKVGEFWGVKYGEDDAFLIRKGYGPFQVLYAPTDDDTTSVIVRRLVPNQLYRVVLTETAQPLKTFAAVLTRSINPGDTWDPDDPASADADLWEQTDIEIKDIRYGLPSAQEFEADTIGWVLLDYYGRPVLLMAECT